ncbi:MAG TPA: hypothetical protein VEA41_21985 [Salinarimonas sp.]|nr:hypothetical protein [Salinarimonas sp.]
MRLRVFLAVALILAPVAGVADAAPRARKVAKTIRAPISDAVQTTARRIDVARVRLHAQRQAGPAARERARDCRDQALGAQGGATPRMSLYRACLGRG